MNIRWPSWDFHIPRRYRKAFADAGCLAALALLALLAFAPLLAQQKAPCDTRALFFQPPWESARPEGLQLPAETDGLAEARQFVPWRMFLNLMGFIRPSLIWSPLEGCGMPFFGQWRPACLSPFSVPFYILPFGLALYVSVFLKLMVAGWTTFYTARKLGFGPPVAMLAAVAYQFSGHVFLQCAEPISDVAPLLPLLFLTVERLALGQWDHWPVGAVVLAAMAYGGEPEAVAGSILFILVYFLARTALYRPPWRNTLRSMGTILAFLLAGLFVAALQIVPYVELIREVVPTSTQMQEPFFGLPHFLLFFLPHFLNWDPARIQTTGWASDIHFLKILHVGAVSLWLFPLWFALRRFVSEAQRKRVEAMLLACGLLTALALAQTHVPALRASRAWMGPQHLIIGNALALALMAAAAADEWVSLDPRQCMTTLKRMAVFLPLLFVAGFYFLYAWRHAWSFGVWPLWMQLGVAFFFFAATVGLLAFTLFKPSLPVIGYGLSAVAFCSLMWAYKPDLVGTPWRLVFPETEFTSTLREAGSRIGGSEALRNWPLAGNLVPQIYSPGGAVLKRQAVFWERAKADPLLLRRAGASALLLTKEDIQGAFASVRPMLAIKHVFSSGAILFQDMGAKPRAWVAYDWRTADTLDPAAIASDLPPIIEGAGPPPPPSTSEGPEAKVTIAVEFHNRIAVDVETSRPGMLVLADTYYPGWSVRVDGQATKILPCDGMFRAVPIAEGNHRVYFRYNPLSLRLGFCTGIAAALFVLFEMRHLAIRVARKKWAAKGRA
ncbi:MAG TPA: YfhO family protein [Candidatus Hydrogenedentes bacterium]|nr:YfhO family protein [Candidatus Hydrogenedentota bacterium]